MSPPSFPPQVPSSGRPLPIRRVLWSEFPDLIGTYQPTPTSRLPSRLASFPSLGPTTASPSSLPPGRDDSPRAWTISIAAPAPPHHDGEDEISQVPGRPLRTCPALRPRRTAVPGHYRTRDVVFRTLNNVDSAFAPFEARSRGLHTLCVRFAAGVAPGPRNTRFRLVANLDRSGLSPAGSHRWFTVMSFRLHGVLHHQASPGAIKDGLASTTAKVAPTIGLCG